MVDVTTRVEGAVTVVAVSGEIDLYSSPRMREAIVASITRRHPHVVVDLGGVSYMDSSGIATLVEALQLARKHEGRLLLASITARVREVFEVARLESVFEIFPDVAAALKAASTT